MDLGAALPLELLWRSVAHIASRISASSFDAAVTIDEANKDFLRVLQRSCKSRGKEIVSVPEDLLTILILKRGGPFLTQRYVREVIQFEPRIGEALIDCLGIPE